MIQLLENFYWWMDGKDNDGNRAALIILLLTGWMFPVVAALLTGTFR